MLCCSAFVSRTSVNTYGHIKTLLWSIKNSVILFVHFVCFRSGLYGDNGILPARLVVERGGYKDLGTVRMRLSMADTIAVGQNL